MHVVVGAARRTAVVPRGGAFKDLKLFELAGPVIQSVLSDSNTAGSDVDCVIMGNALGAGGNPARASALAAGLPERVTAQTIDSQCCAGMDAIAYGAALIRSGMARVVIAGGMESFSQAPIRHDRTTGEIYHQPPFTPWPERDPDMIKAAADLSDQRGYDRAALEAFARGSHAKALASQEALAPEIISLCGVTRDKFTRNLTRTLCQRARRFNGPVTSATMAVEADAAAAVILLGVDSPAPDEIVWRDGLSLGGRPDQPGLGCWPVTDALMEWQDNLVLRDVHVIEVMEAFAAQAMAFIEDSGVQSSRVNARGGALARGHPIGASGSILLVRAWHRLKNQTGGSSALTTIAAAGGIASAALLQKGV